MSVADTTEPLFASFQGELPPLRAVMHIMKPGKYPHMIDAPSVALDIVMTIKEGLREMRQSYGNIGTVHLFMAVPAGLAVLVGQCLNTFGAVQTYEHVSADGSGRYRPAALLRPSA